ncbi:pantothenate kinase, partial [Candidatus Bathyarchaeota archaeon]
MIIGIDVGAYLTKGVLIENDKIIKKFSIVTDEKAKSALKTLKILLDKRLDSVRAIGISGGGSRKIKRDLLGLPTVTVNEIQAIGLGGLMLSKRKEALIVNAGTGTAIVAAYE